MDRTTFSNVNANHAGRSILQPQGYRAFFPAPLPPLSPVRLDGELLSLLIQAHGAVTRLDGALGAIPDPDLFVMMYVRREAVLSSRIEGTRSSIHDLLAAEAGLLAPRNRTMFRRSEITSAPCDTDSTGWRRCQFRYG